MRDCKLGWWEEKRGKGGRGGGREEDSQPSGHEMMLKEVMLLESVENEGPEGLWVKVERLGMWGCLGAGAGVGLGPLPPVLNPPLAMWVLPMGGWLGRGSQGHSGPGLGGTLCQGPPGDTGRNRLGIQAGTPRVALPRCPRARWHQGRGGTRVRVTPGSAVPTQGALPTQPSGVLSTLQGCSLGCRELGHGAVPALIPAPQGEAAPPPRPTLTGCYWRNLGTSWTSPQPWFPSLHMGIPAFRAWPGAPLERPPGPGTAPGTPNNLLRPLGTQQGPELWSGGHS